MVMMAIIVAIMLFMGPILPMIIMIMPISIFPIRHPNEHIIRFAATMPWL